MDNLSVLWVARGLAICLSLFLGVFALDELQAGKPVARAVIDVAIHLWPSALVLVLVAVSWRRQWVGAAGFVALAAAYAIVARFRMDWVLAISGPLFTIGLLYFWSWQAGQVRGSVGP